MAFTKEERRAFAEAARPLIRWLAESVHPHHKVVVTTTSAELLTGEMAVHDESFLPDQIDETQQREFTGAMTEARAREILSARLPLYLTGEPPFTVSFKATGEMMKSYDLTPDELEAIAWWMRNKAPTSR
jgi:hypothetical protein